MSIFDEFDEILKKIQKMGSGSSGYSVSVVYNSDGKPIVNVKTHGNFDREALEKEIREMYPNAEIRGLEKKSIVREVGKEENKEKKKPLIWEDDEEH